MARSFSTATLTVKIQEGIVLGGQDMGSTNSFSVTGIKNVVKRLMTATTDLMTIMTFHASAEGAGQYIEGNVRYIRITNLDDTNHICLIFVNEHSDEFAVKVDKGQSFIFNADMSGGVVDVFDANGAGSATTGSIADLTTIKVQSDTASCDIETYIATA
jgi:hypothetical protein